MQLIDKRRENQIHYSMGNSTTNETHNKKILNTTINSIKSLNIAWRNWTNRHSHISHKENGNKLTLPLKINRIQNPNPIKISINNNTTLMRV